MERNEKIRLGIVVIVVIAMTVGMLIAHEPAAVIAVI